MDHQLEDSLKNLFSDQEENIEKAVRCLKVLAHPARLKILCVLKHGECSVQELVGYTNLAQATVSQHLSLLKDRDIVRSTKQGNFSIYRIANPSIIQLFELIKEMYCTTLVSTT